MPRTVNKGVTVDDDECVLRITHINFYHITEKENPLTLSFKSEGIDGTRRLPYRHRRGLTHGLECVQCCRHLRNRIGASRPQSEDG